VCDADVVAVAKPRFSLHGCKQFLLLPVEMTSSYPPCLLGARLSQEDGKLRAAEGWEGASRQQPEVPALFRTPSASTADHCGRDPAV